MPKSPKIAIIGAGLTGLYLAQRLRGAASVTVFEKSRGLGGRMSTRRAEGYQFDHGAQFFSARSADFAAFLRPYLEDGTVKPWSPRLVHLSDDGETPQWTAPRYVAVPGMTALAKAMAQDIEVQRALQINKITRQDTGRYLTCTDGQDHGPYDWVISTAPALQTARLMPQEFTGHQALDQARMQGCYSLMLGFKASLQLPWDAAKIGNDPLAWIAVDSSKPGRTNAQSVVAQTSNTWAEANLERDQQDVRTELVSAFAHATGHEADQADYISLHRWRYASVATPASAPFLIDPAHGLAAAGDWCGAGKIEAAFDSASALSETLGQLLT